MKSENGIKVALIAGGGILLVIFACLAGLGLGVYYGWIVNPVEWVDASPEVLAQEYKEEYLRMAIDSYGANGDCVLGSHRYQVLGEGAAGILENINNNPGIQHPESISAFMECVSK